ncbi:peptidyl-alpha-hydroxyglycine-alpha-amidating lyase 1 isoform X2 [Choristoneura fumiferana]|uniref:peptidyl-alpha-hydroxyglycine-alpha-amidating lyase 1 isoform X2 n=1 Tax=Choristoneura fumiferana TaxID=7141 RepID=UPI003D154906
MKFYNKYIPCSAFHVFVVLFCNIHTILGRRFPDEGYYPGGYYSEQQAQLASNIKLALEKLNDAPKYVSNWPDPNIKMGQVSGVALNNAGQVLVFHRASNTWDAGTFSNRNVYQAIGEPPIPHPTVLVFNDTGELVDMWGKNLFYMPHGITVDREANVWVTDVALHQVFKFAPGQREQPALVLGEKFVPGNDELHFCKPSAVAVLASGEFFVADGYCNTRIMKFAPDGSLMLQWGGGHFDGSPFAFNVPHALTLAEDRGLVCVADRERGRAACFRADNGTYVTGFKNWLIGGRLFSVAYSPVKGGRLYVVNGPGTGARVRGYVIEFASQRMVASFAPGGDFSNPHDVVASPDGSKVYVAELNPYRVYKFEDETLRNESKVDRNTTVPVKPTTTVVITCINV